MISELCTCDIGSIPLPLLESTAKEILIHLIKGIHELHQHKIIHRDIKP